MAKWTRTLKLQPEWDRCRDDEITRQELAASIAAKLKALRPINDSAAEETRLELAEVFEEMADDMDLSEGEFNGMMGDLYDWGDMSLDGRWNGAKVCWVDAMPVSP